MSTFTDWKPRSRPARVTLEGRYCRLEPLDPGVHSDALFAATMAPGVDDRLRYLMESPQERPVFDAWMTRAAASDDPLFYGVVDRVSGRCEGRQALMRITPEHGVIEIGHVLWGPAIARTRIATEALYLSARYVFDSLGYRRFEWKCDSRNEPSKRAARRFGFADEGLFRQHMVVKGQSRDTSWFAMTDGDWSILRPAFERWLDPSNFEPEGRQVATLERFRTAAG